MTTPVKHLRSSTANKRPTASGLADGRLAINTASGTPGLYFVDSASGVVKVGPTHVGSTAPNVSPAGSSGNSLGELWVNNSTTIHGLNYYTGSAFVNLTPSGTTSAAGLVELATAAETQTGTDAIRAVTPSGLQSKVSDSTSTTSSTTIASATAVKTAYDLANAALPKSGGRVTGALEIGPSGSLSFEGNSDDGFETTLAVVDPTADRTITFPNVTGTVVTTGDQNTVTATMIASGTITNSEINASAAIALSKLATGALPTGITIASANIVDGTIVNADINASAAIADTKLATISTPGKVSGSAITSGTIDTSGELRITNTAPAIRLTESDGTATHNQVVLVKNADNFEIQTRTSAGAYTASDYLIFGGATGATNHVWRIAGTERARIDSSGRFLIGTSSSLSVNGIATGVQIHDTQTTDGASLSIARFANDTSGPQLNIGKSRNGTIAAGTIVQDNDELGSLYFDGDDGTDLNTPAARIAAFVDGTPGANNMPGRLVFSTTADGSASPTERLRIDSAGQVGIGTTSPTATLHINGDAKINGRVGIGDTGDATKLRITGDIPDDGELFAVGVAVSATASNSTTAIYGFISDINPTTSSANTVTHIYRYSARQLSSFGSATVTNQYGFFADSSLTGATNDYGFYGAITDAANRWNFYAGGSAPNYFAGNVGIGTDSPTGKLHVSGETRLQSSGTAVVFNNGTEDYGFIGNSLGSLFINAGGTLDTLLLQTNGATRLSIDPSGTTTLAAATSTAPFIATIASSEVARIDGGGRLLMGKSTTNNVAGLTAPGVQIDGPDGRASVAITRRSNDVGQSYLVLAKTRSTTSSAVAVQEGDVIGEIRWSADDGTDLNSYAALIRTRIDGAVAENDLPGRFEILTTASGNATPTERFRITKDGVQAYNQSTPVAVNTTATLTVANLKNGIITSTTAAAVTMTLPTGTDTEAGFSGIYTNMTFEWSVINTGATNAVTVSGNTGHTLTGSGAVAASTAGRFASRRTAANTFVTYRLS